MLVISSRVVIPDDEIDITAIRAQGAGGQHVNKTSTAIHLRFDIHRSLSLPDSYKQRLLLMHHHLITAEGMIVIKSQEYRSQEMNRAAALERLATLIRSAGVTEKARRPTTPGVRARQRRTDEKTRRGKTKALRGKIKPD